METEVTITTNEESNELQTNVSINKEITNVKDIQPQNESSITSENIVASATDIQGFGNSKSSGASPKILEEKTTNTTNSPKVATNNSKTKTEEGASAHNTILSSDGQYFFEDEVFRIDKKGGVKFGLILETCGTSSSDEDDEDDEYGEVLDKGEVRVVWFPEGKISIHFEDSIGLADRTLMPGDVVRRLVPGKDTQIGYCRDINMKADIKVPGTQHVIKNVNAERLKVMSKWQRDTAVCLDSWVGSTKEVEEKAILRTAYGCRIEIPSKYFFNFKDLNSPHKIDNFNPLVIYPGNKIIGRLPSIENIKILTPNIPLHINKKKGKPLTRKFTIESVYTDTVWVHWQCKALSDETNLQSITMQPNPCVTGDNLKRLKRLNLFESCMLQIQDRTYLTFSACDTIMKESDWDKEQAIKFKLIYQQQKEENQKIFVGTGGWSETRHNVEKMKKRLSLDDKFSNKLKRSLIKSDKLSKKETLQESSTNNDKYNSSTASTTTNTKDDSEWFSTEDEAEIDEENCENLKQFTEDCVSSTTTLSTCSTPSPRMSPKHLTKRQLKKKGRKKPFISKPLVDFNPKEGDELVNDALLVYSTATVVWQDGTIESNIPSTQLYPIHHLDNHEFFPGDFVICDEEDSHTSYRDYGVIQTVDHQGRTAHVKWFTTYTSVDEPKPSYKGESENSVYDLKDHPDFQYRPGTMVIRVANFVGKDANCTAGQIIDNYIDGLVEVWWVDGHISKCWPQDLFEVGQYDQGDWGHDSEDSWETESENSELGGESIQFKLWVTESHFIANVERARVAIARLEEIFNISPNLQNPEVMRKLLTIYKGCRYFDRLLNTNFFHEDNFMGLIQRVRKVDNQSIQDRVQDQKNRLFSEVTSPSTNKQQHQYQYSAIVAVNSGGGASTGSVRKTTHQSLSQQLQTLPESASKDYAPKVLFNLSSSAFKCFNMNNHGTNSIAQLNSQSSLKRRFSQVAAAREPQSKKTEDVPINTNDEVTADDDNNISTVVSNILPKFDVSPGKNKQYNAEKNQLLNSVMLNIENAFQKTNQLTANWQDDSGNYSGTQTFDGSSTTYTSSSDLTNIDPNNSLAKEGDNQKSISSSSVELSDNAAPELVCVRLCSLLKGQLIKCCNELREKYYKEDECDIGLIDGDETVNGDEEVVVKMVRDIASSNKDVTTENVSTPSPPLLEDDNDISLLALTAGDLASGAALNVNHECFQVLSNAPKSHKFHVTIFHPNNAQQYYKAVQREHRVLKNSLPPGVWVRAYEDRMDLLSVMIEGPKKTPYEDGMFFFDIQLVREYPNSPPLCHYISYCSDRLNPNLYEDGKVCVSLLGTWTGKDTEVWSPKSTLLQVIVSIQGLILVPEPYFNEAGYEKQKATQQGKENSRMYNEMVIIKMVQATTKLIQNPPSIFRDEIFDHFKRNGINMYERIKGWMELSKKFNLNLLENVKEEQDSDKTSEWNSQYSWPDFSLVPASRGFCLTVAGLLENFKKRINALENLVTFGNTAATTTTPSTETTTTSTSK